MTKKKSNSSKSTKKTAPTKSGSKPSSAPPAGNRPRSNPGKPKSRPRVQPRLYHTHVVPGNFSERHVALTRSQMQLHMATPTTATPLKLTMASHGGKLFSHHPPGSVLSVIPQDGPRRSAAGSQGMRAGGAVINRLINDEQKALMAWGECVAKPFSRYKAVLPPSEINGLVLQDPYTKMMFQTMSAGGSAGATSADCCCLYQYDGWTATDLVPSDAFTILGPSSGRANGVAGLCTFDLGVAVTFPGVGQGAGPGYAALELGPMDPSIISGVAGAPSGTQFAQVSGGLRVMCVSTTVADGFKGEMFRVSTNDPISAPIQGKLLTEVLTEASKAGSNIHVERFKITQDGMFAASDGTLSSYLEVAAPPLTTEAWRIHNVSDAALNSIQAGQIGFFARGVATGGATDKTVFDVHAVSNYGIEHYASTRVSQRLQYPTGSVSAITATAQALGGLMNGFGTSTMPGLHGVPVGPLAGIQAAANSTPGYAQTLWDGIKQYGPGLVSSLVPEGTVSSVMQWLGSNIFGSGGSEALPLIGGSVSSAAPSVSSGPWGWVEEIAEEAVGVGEELLPWLADAGELAMVLL